MKTASTDSCVSGVILEWQTEGADELYWLLIDIALLCEFHGAPLTVRQRSP